MRREEFIANFPGELVNTVGGNVAFYPNPLPPELNWTAELVNALSDADRAVGRLGGLSSASVSGVNPQLLIRPFMAREAQLSSQIEGTVATVSDLFLFEETEAVEERVPDVREVHNYSRSLQFGLEALKQRPLSLGLVKELHRILMDRVRGGDKTPGQFRTGQVFLGKSKRIEDATFVPPPPLMVQPALEKLEQFIQEPSRVPPLVRHALVHYQFECIHPFNDGNGRIGRLLITMLLCADRILPLPMLYLSAYFEKNREEYYQRLREVSLKNGWSEWVLYFLRGVAEQAEDVIKRAAALAELRADYRQRFQQAQRSAKLLQLIDELFQSPAVRTQGVMKMIGLTQNAAQANIDKLVQANVLKEITGQERNRVYLATEIVKVLND